MLEQTGGRFIGLRGPLDMLLKVASFSFPSQFSPGDDSHAHKWH